MNYREKAEEALQKAFEWAKGGGYQEAEQLRRIAETYMQWEIEAEVFVVDDEEDEDTDG